MAASRAPLLQEVTAGLHQSAANTHQTISEASMFTCQGLSHIFHQVMAVDGQPGHTDGRRVGERRVEQVGLGDPRVNLPGNDPHMMSTPLDRVGL